MGTIKDRVRIVLQANPVISSFILRDWPLHGWTHEAGGIDEISVTDLQGLLADPQNAGWVDGFPVDLTIPPAVGEVLVWDGDNFVAGAGGSGVTDHGSLTGLSDAADHAYAFLHNGTRPMTGPLDLADQRITDDNRAASTWASVGIPWTANSAEWSAIETLIGSEGSIAAAIIAASNSGGDHGGLSGLGDAADHAYAFLHDGTRPMTGAFDLDDESITDDNRAASTWASDGISVTLNSTEWTDLKSYIGSEGSIAGAILTPPLETHWRGTNDTGGSLALGICLGVVGATGGVPSFDELDITDGDAARYGGINIVDPFADGETERVHMRGPINGLIDTSSFSLFDELWWGNTGLTNIQPSTGSSTAQVRVGYVTEVGVAGSIYHDPFRMPKLSQLTDVDLHFPGVDPPTAGQILEWDAGNTRWIKADTLQSIGIDGSASPRKVGDFDLFAGTGISLEYSGTGNGIVISATSTGINGDLQDAYDFPTAGAGDTILTPVGTFRLGASTNDSLLYLTTSATDPEPLVALTNLTNSADVSEMINFYNDAVGYNAIYFNGAAGTSDTDSLGHRLWSNGAISLGAYFNTEDVIAYFAAQTESTTENEARAIMRAHNGTTTTQESYVACSSANADTAVEIYSSGEILIEASGSDTIVIDGGDDVIINAGGDVRLNPTSNVIDCASAHLQAVYTVGHGSAPTTATLVAGALTADWSAGACKTITLTGDVSSINWTAPPQVTTGMRLTIDAGAAQRELDLTSVTNIRWFGNYLLDTVTHDIPSGTAVTLTIDYIGSGNYQACLIPEPEAP